MKRLFVFILMLFIPFVIYAEELKIDWQKSFGGNGTDTFSEIIQTYDDNFLAVGYSSSTDIDGLVNKGNKDALIVEFDMNGNILWKNSFGGNDVDDFTQILQAKDGSFVAIGYSSSTDIDEFANKGNKDAIIVKYDNNGNILWKNSFGGNDEDIFSKILQTKDGNFLVIGTSKSTDIDELLNRGAQDIIIVKYSQDGKELWKKSWGGNKLDECLQIFQNQDGEFIASVRFASSDIDGLNNTSGTNLLIAKYDEFGNLLWQKVWGGNRNESSEGLIETSDKSIIVYGWSSSTDIDGLTYNGGLSDGIVIKYDKDGRMLWQTIVGGDASDRLYNAILTQEDEVIISGHSSSSAIEDLIIYGYQDAILIKIDKDGNVLWKKNWGGKGHDNFSGIINTSGVDFIGYGNSNSSDIQGFSNSGDYDAIIVKYDSFDNEILLNYWGGNLKDEFSKILNTPDGGFIVIGKFFSTNIDGLTNKGEQDVAIVKYSVEYNLNNMISENGLFNVEQQGKYAVITPASNDGYEVDKIIVKDKEGNVLDVEVTKLEDGTYSFDLYTDVSVEVLFKEKLVNPKTGVVSYIGAVLSILFISIATFCVLVFNKKSYRL